MRLLKLRNTRNKLNSFFNKNDIWFLYTFLLTFLYFKLPNSDGYAGFYSVRIGLLIFIFLIVWISSQNIPKWISWPSIILVLIFNFKLNTYYQSVAKDLNTIAYNCSQAAKHINPNSVILPINYSNHWLAGHFSNYLGVNKPMVILENYELSTGYFPLIWNFEDLPSMFIGKNGSTNLNCITWVSNKQNQQKMIDYIFISGDFPENDNCAIEIQKELKKESKLIYKNEHCKLFKIKK